MVLRLLFFDSGVGGIAFGSSLFNGNLAGFEKLMKAGCDVELTYFCDNKNGPYFDKSFEQIVDIGNANLLALNCIENDFCFVACNTVSSQNDHLLIPDSIRDRISFLIRPSVRAVMLEAQKVGASARDDGSGVADEADGLDAIDVGLFATPRTIDNGVYQGAIERMSGEEEFLSGPKISLHTFGPAWSSYIQRDLESGLEEGKRLVQMELESLLENGGLPLDVKIVCLYCTHFPLYADVIKGVFNRLGRDPLLLEQGRLFDNQVAKIVDDKLAQLPSSQTSASAPSDGSLKVKIITTGPRMPRVPDVVRDLHGYKVKEVEEVDFFSSFAGA